MAKGNVVSKAEIVKYVKEAFDPEDIERVWTFLGRKFHFNIPAWKDEFNQSLDLTIRHKSVPVQFMEFGKRKIEPLLNDILCRRNYPTWIILLSYILRDKIDTIQNRNWQFKNRY